MHLVCLGVMKKLINFWVRGRKDIRLTNICLERIDSTLKQIKNCVPKEFARLPRPITEFEHWKATEFRQFILYTGKIIFAYPLIEY